MIFRLDERLIFPEPALAEPDGLLAVGGDLSLERLLLAYQHGIFPWYGDDMPILWYAPHQRFILFPAELRVSKSMQQVLRSGKFAVTTDVAFEAVIRNCAKVYRKEQEGTWITTDMIDAYLALQKAGHAHSVEVWLGDELAGGLYGVAVGGVFCGESMFSKVSNASKTALIWLCRLGKYKLIDCQVHTEHLERLGARFIHREEYMEFLH